jgi:membrane protein
MARKKDQAKRKGDGLADTLAPVAGIVVLGAAMGRTVLDRRSGQQARTAGRGQTVELDRRPPGAAIEDAKEKDQPSGLRATLDRLGERVPPLGRILEVQQRYSELRGNNVAAAVAFQAFVSLFPLMLVIVSAVGFFSHHSGTDVAARIVGNLGLTGEAADIVRAAVENAEESRAVTGPIGLIGLLWSGLGLVNALQFAYNQVWQVEERGMKDKAVGVGWLVGAAVIFIGASALTTVLRWLPGVLAPLGVAVGLLVNFALWLWTSKVLPNREVGWRPLIPGAIFGAFGMEVLKVLGGIYVPRAVANSSELYGTLGVVFAVLAWLLIFGRLIIYSAVLDVVLHERRAGTVRAVVEVPAQSNVEPADDVTRSGRVTKQDLAS